MNDINNLLQYCHQDILYFGVHNISLLERLIEETEDIWIVFQMDTIPSSQVCELGIIKHTSNISKILNETLNVDDLNVAVVIDHAFYPNCRSDDVSNTCVYLFSHEKNINSNDHVDGQITMMNGMEVYQGNLVSFPEYLQQWIDEQKISIGSIKTIPNSVRRLTEISMKYLR
jgi:hypothetical protein